MTHSTCCWEASRATLAAAKRRQLDAPLALPPALAPSFQFGECRSRATPILDHVDVRGPDRAGEIVAMIFYLGLRPQAVRGSYAPLLKPYGCARIASPRRTRPKQSPRQSQS